MRVYGGPQLYHQSFTAIAADRASEALTRLQTAPAVLSADRREWPQTSVLVICSPPDSGLAASPAEATKRSFPPGGPYRRSVLRAVPNFRLAVSPAFSFRCHRGSRSAAGCGLTGGRKRRAFRRAGLSTDRRCNFAFVSQSERVGRQPAGVLVLYKLREAVSLFASYSTGFRQPTLNELYRAFRVGDVLTLANENLQAEHARNYEGGFNASGFDGRLYIRSGVFCTSLSRPVANRTLSVTPSLITRQRQNLGRTRSCGIESDGKIRLTSEITGSAGYLLSIRE